MIVTVLTVLQVICCLLVIVSILLQKAPTRGLSGAISGSAETFFGSHQDTGMDALLAKITKVFAVLFIILSFCLCLVG